MASALSAGSGSLWSATAQMPSGVLLDRDLNVDVCVVGGGIAGLTTAYLLARTGVQVALLEARELGAGETSHTTAHIALPDEHYWRIEQSYGADNARLIAESFAGAIDLIERIVQAESIDCDFERVDGYLISCAQQPEAVLQREYAAARRAGVEVERVVHLPFGHFSPQASLRFPMQAQFHPLRYLAALARAIEGASGVIYTHTPVLSIEEDANGVTVHTEKYKVRAAAAVVATNTPINDRLAIHTKQTAWQSYVVAASVPAGMLPHSLLWDDADPYHYVRLARSPGGHELVIVGGEDHKSGQSDPERCYRAVEEWLRERFPMAGPIEYRWSGQVLEPLDGLAYLGRNPGDREVYLITGDSGNGITHATVGAALVTDLIARRPNRWEAVYSPSRKPMKQVLRFARDVAALAGP